MSTYFTSIFHEAVIPVNEFKGNAEEYYSRRESNERLSGSHDKATRKEYEKEKRRNEKLRDGHIGARTIKAANDEKKEASIHKDVHDRINWAADHRRRTKNESFLLNIDLD